MHHSPYVTSLEGTVIGGVCLILTIPVTYFACTTVPGCPRTTGVLHKGANGAGGPLGHPMDESVLNVVGCLEPQDLVNNCANENHGLFAIPVLVLGASQILR